MILVTYMYAQKPNLNAHAGISSGVWPVSSSTMSTAKALLRGWFGLPEPYLPANAISTKIACGGYSFEASH